MSRQVMVRAEAGLIAVTGVNSDAGHIRAIATSAGATLRIASV